MSGNCRQFVAATFARVRVAILLSLSVGLAVGLSPVGARAQNGELSAVAALIQQGQLADAESRLQQYLAKLPRSARANSLLGQVYLRQGRLPLAEAALQKSIAVAPALIEPRLELGDVYFAGGKFDSALAAYQAAQKLAPHDVRANLALAKLFLDAGQFANSIAAAENIPTPKRTAELLPTLAADYFGLRQTEKADLEIQGMLRVAGKQPDLIPELAEFFLAHKDFKSSEQLLALAQAKQPTTDRLLIDTARTKAGLAQLDDAQKILESVLARSPKSLDALVAAGEVASQQGDWPSASEAFSLAATLAPERPDILYKTVSAQLYANQTDPALKNARKLHALLPDDLRSTYMLALALFGARDLEEAKPLALQVLKEHPEDREMNLLLADAAFNDEHNLPAARQYVDICLKQNPEDPGALYYLGMIQKMQGDVNAAVQALTKSVAGNPKNADAQGALGTVCLQVGDVPRAVAALEQAVLLSPDEAQNHYQLALAYSRSSAPDKAKTQLEIYQRLRANELKQDKDGKGPSTSEIPPMGMNVKP